MLEKHTLFLGHKIKNNFNAEYHFHSHFNCTYKSYFAFASKARWAYKYVLNRLCRENVCNKCYLPKEEKVGRPLGGDGGGGCTGQ